MCAGFYSLGYSSTRCQLSRSPSGTGKLHQSQTRMLVFYWLQLTDLGWIAAELASINLV